VGQVRDRARIARGDDEPELQSILPSTLWSSVIMVAEQPLRLEAP
jgi:hypothetical protein